MTDVEGPLLEAAAAYARAVRRVESAGANPLQDDGARAAAGELLRAAEVYRQARGGHGRNPPREETPQAAVVRAALDYVAAQRHALAVARRLLDAATGLD